MTRLTAEQVRKDNGGDAVISALSLHHKALSDVSCLGAFQSLERLDLASNSLTSLEGLRLCVNLKWLSVVQNKLESLEGVQGLSKLTVLNAGKNKLRSMEEVRSLEHLRALILNDNEIASICKLDRMKELNTLVLSKNPIREVGDCLVNVKSITKLSLSHCQLQAIGSSLKSCGELRELRLAHNEIKSLPAELSYNKKLQNLDMGNNVIMRWSDVKVINSLTNLKNLNLLGNPVAEKEKLAKKIKNSLPNLHVFNSKPLVKGTKNVDSEELDKLRLASDSKLEVLTEKGKGSSKHDGFTKGGSLQDSSSVQPQEDLKHESKKRKGKSLKIEEAPISQKEGGKDEKGHKMKKFESKLDEAGPLEEENDLKVRKKKSKEKHLQNDIKEKEDGRMPRNRKKKLDELDIVDDSEVSFAELMALDSAAISERSIGADKIIGDSHSVGGLVISSSKKKKKTKKEGLGTIVNLPPVLDVGLGGPSTWGDE